MPQKQNKKYKTGDLVETLCDDEEESCWLPARVSKAKATSDKVVLTLLGDTESFQVEQSFVRLIPNHGGKVIRKRDIIEGAECSVWHAQSASFFPAVVQFFDNEDTAVILYTEYDDEEEVPVDYIRCSEPMGADRSGVSFASPKKSEISELSDSDDERPSSPHFLSKQPSFFDEKEDYQIEAEIIWEKLDAHLKLGGIQLKTFLKRNVSKDGHSVDATQLEKAVKRNLKLTVIGHQALSEVVSTAQHKALKLGLLKEKSEMIGHTGVGALSPVKNSSQVQRSSTLTSMSMRSEERGAVGKHRSMRVPLPEDPLEALDEMLEIVRPALKRLKITPLSFFNMANKKKRRFVDSADIAIALHSLTKVDVNSAVMGEVMLVLDPEGTNKVDTKTMKLNFKMLVADEAVLKYEKEKKEKIEMERQKREEEKLEMARRKAEKKDNARREIERLESEKKALLKRQRESKRNMSFVEVKSKKVQKEPKTMQEPPPVTDRPRAAKHAPVAVRPIPTSAPVPSPVIHAPVVQAPAPPAPTPVVRVSPKKVEPWQPGKGMVVEVNVGDEEDEEDGDQWLPGSVVSDMHADGTIEVRMLVGYETEDATFETDSYYCREIERQNRVKCYSGLRVSCLNALSSEFQEATIISAITDDDTVMVKFDRRDDYDSEDSEEEEEEEQEVPMSYLRSLEGMEDIEDEVVEEAVEKKEEESIHTIDSETETEEEVEKDMDDETESGSETEEEEEQEESIHTIESEDEAPQIKPVREVRTPESARTEVARTPVAKHQEDFSQSYASRSESAENELSELLDCVGCRDHFQQFYSLTGSNSAYELFLTGKGTVFSVNSVSLAQRQTLWKLLKEQFGSRDAPSTSRGYSTTPYKVEHDCDKGFLSFLRVDSVDDTSMSVDQGGARADSREASMDRAALYGWQRMLEEKDAREETRKKFKVHDDEHKEEDEEETSDIVHHSSSQESRNKVHHGKVESVTAWDLPVSVTVVLGDGAEIRGTPAETSASIMAATDNFIFRNLDCLLDALALTNSRQRVGQHDLPLRTISHQLRKLGAPISVTTGPLYLWQYLVDFHSSNSDPSFGLSDTPEHSSANYCVLLPFIANKHLMDMLTLASKTDDYFSSLLTGWRSVESDEIVNEETISTMVEALSTVLMKVAKEHAVGRQHNHHHEGQTGHQAYESCVNMDSNSGRHPLWWSRASSFTPMAEDFVRSIHHDLTRVSSDETPSTLQHRIYDMLKQHSRAQDSAQKISTSYRTREAAEEMLILKKEAESSRHGSWLKQVSSEASSEDDDESASLSSASLSDEVDEGFLQDRMCYFIIGNLHRLKAELKDRGLLHKPSRPGDTTDTVPVATVVRALKVATACTYPPLELAKLLVKASKLGNYSSYSSETGSIWDMSVDVSQLDVQIDKYLMTI